MTQNQRQAQALKKGDQIGVYEIKGVIHIERSGIVYRIWNEHMNTVEVLAEYFPSDIARRLEDGHTVGPKSENERPAFEDGLKQFLQQAEILSDIKQANIIRVHNELEFNDTGYMIMDDVDGTPLSKLTGSSASFNQTELEYILVSVLEGLQKVHEHCTFHGDIHPSNIIIKKNGEPVLIDFAAAQLAIASHSDSPKQFLREGYASAELYNRVNSPGAASDLYSLGATIYRCITKTNPVLAPKRLSAINKNKPDPHKSLLGLANSEYSETFLNTISRMLEPDVNKRYQSATEVLGDLTQNVADAESTEEVHKLIDDSQLVSSTDSGYSRVFWVGTAVVAAFIIFGLLSFQEDEKQTETLVSEADTKLVAVLNKQEAQTATSAKEKREPETAIVSEGVTENTQAGVSAQPAVDENLSGQKSDSLEVSTHAPVEKTSLLSSDQEQMAEPEGVLHKVQDFPTEIKQSPPLQETQLITTVDNDGVLIEQHLVAAEEALRNFNLTTPPGDNAYQNYQAVLDIDPENVEAGKGLHLIVEKYVWLIERSIEQDNINNAQIYLKRAEAILPNSPEVQRGRVVIKEAGN